MAESAISVAIITIGCVICATVLVAALYPSMYGAASSAVSTTVKLGERIETSVEIIQETDQSPYEYVWVKNIGSSQLVTSQINKSDIFFGKTTDFKRIPHDADLSPAPCWSYTFENDNNNNDRWDEGETLNITIYYDETIDSGDYFVKIVLYNAISDEDTFSI